MYSGILILFFLYFFSFLSFFLKRSLREELTTLRFYLKKILGPILACLFFLFSLFLPLPFSLLLFNPFVFFLLYLRKKEELYLSLSLSSLYAFSFVLFFFFSQELLVLSLLPLFFLSLTRVTLKEESLRFEVLCLLNIFPALLFLLIF